MRKNQSSLTAAGIALARAVESQKPVGERIFLILMPEPFTVNGRRAGVGWAVS